MMRTVHRINGPIAGLLALMLGVSSAAAQDVAGWYIGIYGGGAAANDVDLRADAYFAQLFGPGTVETPTEYINDGGIDPDFFDFLTLGPDEYAFADFGYATALFTPGTLDLTGSATAGVVVGYGFGNGVRIEGDLSGAAFAGTTFTGTEAVFQDADGFVEPTGEWIWFYSGDYPDFVDPPMPLEDYLGISFRRNVGFLLASAYYDFDNATAFTPYVGAGVGVALVTTDCLCAAPKNTQLAPAAQVGVGVRIAVKDRISLDLGYRYKMAAGREVYAIDTIFDGFGGYEAVAFRSSGFVGVHTAQMGVTFALQ